MSETKDSANTSWLSRHHEAIAILSRVEQQLDFLSVVFDDVGNDKISTKLDALFRDVRFARTEISSAISTMLSEDLRRTQSDIAGIITACLDRSSSPLAKVTS